MSISLPLLVNGGGSRAVAAGSYYESERRPVQCLVTVSYSFPPPPSYVAHSSADRDGGIELDYVSFFYYTYVLSAVINTKCNVGRLEREEGAS